MTEIKVGNKVVDVSNRDKIFFPDAGITKGAVIDYYERIGETMLPHLQARPITMHRFPDGIEGEGFYQKNAPKNVPDWIESQEIKNREGGTTQYLLCNDISTLVYMANYGNITPHIWLSRVDNLENPDRMIFDLDPSSDDFEQVRKAARLMNDLLANDLELTIFLMTTGSRGLHVIVPLDSKTGFDDVRDVAGQIARYLEEKNQELLTTEVRKNKRQGKLFIDIARNAYAQTTVAPYSLRAKAGAPVAVPIEYDELSDSSLNSQKYNLKNIFKRLGQKPDPWKDINKHRFSIDTIRKKLDDLGTSEKRKGGK
jgi:bifunctional non-homologous end joining protein LigD